MKKQELITTISQQLAGEVSKTTIEKTVNALLDTIGGELAAGRDIILPGFGKFEVRTRAARKGRNPATGQEMQIAEKKNVGFKAQKALLDKVR